MDWLDELGGRLREAETPPPAGGWERLERELPTLPKGPWFIRNWPRVAAVAAAVLICVATGDAFRRAYRVQGDVRVVVASAAADSMRLGSEYNSAVGFNTGDGLAAWDGQMNRMQPGKPMAAVARAAHQVRMVAAGRPDVSAAKLLQTTALPVDRDTSVAAKTSVADADGTERDDGNGRADALQNSSRKETSMRYAGTTTSGEEWLREETRPESRRRKGKVALGLFAGGGTVSKNHGRGANTFLSGAMIPGTSVNLVKHDYRNCSYDHKLPLSFGVTFGREFPYGLWLESGVVYSLLRSEVAVQYGDVKLQQRLHFIGIPLRVNWRVLDRKGFSLYIGAGAMAEKCISARFGKETVHEKGLQGSIFGLAGMQYRLGGPAALYFEPGVSYYFTQTQLRTSRTDSPVDFSLQFGVRFTF